jgi:superfamily II DNA or RNA helicase
LQKFGPPSIDKRSGGDVIQVRFEGDLRPEQVPAVDAVLSACHDDTKTGGILNVFCGGGKTTMALNILAQLGRKTMIVVHKDFLLNQWRERIEQFLPHARVGLIKAKVVDIDDKDIVIASLQSLAMKSYPVELFSSFGTLIVDEVHHTSAEVFSQALKKTVFKYTIGLSATVQRKDGLSKVFTWFLGDIVYKSTKRVDTVQVSVKEYYHSAQSYCKEHMIGTDKLNTARMINNICAFGPRTQLILDMLYKILEKEPHRKVLILSDRRSHLQEMYEKLNADAKSVGLYMGGMKQGALEECEAKQIILATFAIASEGYDQRGLDTLVLASPKSDIVQSVGRILRDKPHERKHTPLVLDIIDCFSIFEKQGNKRVKYYRSQGYIIDGIPDKSQPVFEMGKCLIVD